MILGTFSQIYKNQKGSRIGGLLGGSEAGRTSLSFFGHVLLASGFAAWFSPQSLELLVNVSSFNRCRQSYLCSNPCALPAVFCTGLRHRVFLRGLR